MSLYNCNGFRVQWSFPVIHKVDNVGIITQLLMRINLQWLPLETILMQIYICYHALY